jgi:hypothetical protein
VIEDGDTFEWRGQTLPYLVHDYNTTALNERCFEVPIAVAWHESNEMMDPDFLEVGNVLSHYGWGGHEVVDLFEVADGVRNEDVRDLVGEWDRIVSISTVEHVGQQEGVPDEFGPLLAVNRMMQALRPGGEMLLTVPFGQNPHLDGQILRGELGPLCGGSNTYCGTMTRDWATGLWDWHEGPPPWWAPGRENGWPNAVWVTSWRKP